MTLVFWYVLETRKIEIEEATAFAKDVHMDGCLVRANDATTFGRKGKRPARNRLDRECLERRAYRATVFEKENEQAVQLSFKGTATAKSR